MTYYMVGRKFKGDDIGVTGIVYSCSWSRSSRIIGVITGIVVAADGKKPDILPWDHVCDILCLDFLGFVYNNRPMDVNGHWGGCG